MSTSQRLNRLASTSSAAPRRAPAPFGARPARRRQHQICMAAAQQGGGFGAEIAKFAKKVQGALPIIGLVSRLASPDGGFDDLPTYAEYCRAHYDKAPRDMVLAMQELEKRHGKLAASRWVLLMAWMVTQGLGSVAAKDIIAAARRLRVTQDVEVEMDRFEGARLVARKKYDMVAPPTPKQEDVAATLSDALCTMCLGLKEGQAVAAEDAKLLVKVLMGTLPELPLAQAEAIVAQRSGASSAPASATA